MITIPIGPQSFSRDFLNGEGHFNFDLPGGLNTGQPFAGTVTEVLNTGSTVEKSVLTFGDPNGLAPASSADGVPLPTSSGFEAPQRWPRAPRPLSDR